MPLNVNFISRYGRTTPKLTKISKRKNSEYNMLKNKASFTGAELLSIFGAGNVICDDSGFDTTGVSIDTRTIEAGNIFVALKGEKIDGHSKVADAFGKGAAVAVVLSEWHESNKDGLAGKAIVTVENTIQALGKLGKFHRHRFDFPVIAIGGSNGKTTTKEMTAHLLSEKYSVLKTHENFNNQIGLPLMLLRFGDEYDVAVLELATNQPGEIAVLSNLAAPTHGLITNIGKEHLEGFIDLDGVEMEETFLFGHIRKHGGIAFINADDGRISRYMPVLEKRVIFGMAENQGLNVKIKFDEKIRPILTLSFEGRQVNAHLSCFGMASALNAAAAAAIGFKLELSGEQIKKGLESFRPQKGHGYGRMFLEEKGGLTILNDCYNANPSSMEMAIDTLAMYPCNGRRIAVLGDMREMGDASAEEHISILNYAAEKADLTLVTGGEMLKAATSINNPDILLYETKAELTAYLIDNATPEDIILVKGSRGMKMEDVV